MVTEKGGLRQVAATVQSLELAKATVEEKAL